MEAGEYRAEQLTEVVSKEEVDPDTMVPVWDNRGKFTMRKGSSKVAEPVNAEELRKRLTIMRNAYVLISLRHTNRPMCGGYMQRTVRGLRLLHHRGALSSPMRRRSGSRRSNK